MGQAEKGEDSQRIPEPYDNQDPAEQGSLDAAGVPQSGPGSDFFYLHVAKQVLAHLQGSAEDTANTANSISTEVITPEIPGGTVVWHSFSEVEDNTERSKVRAGISEGLILSCGKALEVLKRQGAAAFPRTTLDEDGEVIGKSFEWGSADGGFQIFVKSPLSSPEEPESKECHIDGDTDWFDGLRKLGINGSATLEITTKKRVPASVGSGYDGGNFRLDTTMSFEIPNTNDRRVDWAGVRSEYLDTTRRPIAIGSATEYLIADLGLDDGPVDVQLSKLDAHFIEEAWDQIEISTHSKVVETDVIVVDGPTDEELMAIALQETDKELFLETFKNIKRPEVPEELSAEPATEYESASRASREMMSEAHVLLERTFEDGEEYSYDDMSRTLTDMTILSSTSGDLESARGYCRMLELMPDRQSTSLTRAYLALAANGDQLSLMQLELILKEESDTYIEKLASEQDPDAHIDVRIDYMHLLEVVKDCAVYDLPFLANRYIEEYTSGEAVIDRGGSEDGTSKLLKDNQMQWMLKVYYYQSLAAHTGSEASRTSLDSLVDSLVDRDSGRLNPVFVRSSIGSAFALTRDIGIRTKLINSFIELAGNEDKTMKSHGQIFNEGLSLGNYMFTVAKLHTGHEELFSKLDNLIYASVDPLTDKAPREAANIVRSKYMNFHVSVSAYKGESPEAILVDIETERSRWVADALEINSGRENKRMQLERVKAEKASNSQVASAALEFARLSNFGDSNRLLENITDPETRLAAYVRCWAKCKTSEEVRTLMPEDMILGLDDLVIDLTAESTEGSDHIDLDRVDISNEDPERLDLFKTALITATGNLDEMRQRARELSATTALVDVYDFSPNGATVKLLQQFQLARLMGALSKTDMPAAQSIVRDTLVDNSDLITHNPDRGTAYYFSTLLNGFNPENLTSIREFVSNGSDFNSVKARRMAKQALGLMA